MDNDKKCFHLVVVSGKGGVGKTSITASLSVLLKEKGINIMAADTDVDAPNLAILFNAGGTPKDEFHVQTAEKASLIEEKCTHCKKCIDDNYCYFGALSWDDKNKIPVIDTIACEGCKGCMLLCPEKAFNISPVDSGTVKLLESEYGFTVITGETILGAQTSGKLVTEMKQYAEKLVERENIDFMIIDGPPGIGCPVIAAVSETQYAIVIIEPTKAALHDAIRVITVIKNFNIPFGVIINKADMWEDARKDIEQYLKNNGIELLGEIPLDSEWPHAIAEGTPIVKYNPDSKSARVLREIAEKINEKFISFMKN